MIKQLDKDSAGVSGSDTVWILFLITTFWRAQSEITLDNDDDGEEDDSSSLYHHHHHHYNQINPE